MPRLWTLAAFILLSAVGCSGVEAKLTCQTDTDCLEGYVCDTTQTKVCLRGCDTASAATDCLAAQHCHALAGDTKGVCRDDPPESDSGGGDSNSGD